jgi:microcystin-dependent protein
MAQVDPPIGSILVWAGPTNKIPPNYRLCNGDALDRTKNALLFDAIGTSWGGDGANLFNLPDLQGVFLRGVSGTSGRDPDAGDRSSPVPSAPNPGNHGNNVGSFQPDSMQSHAHAANLQRNSISGSNNTKDCDGGGDKFNSDPGLGSLTLTIGNPIATSAGEPRHGAETRPKNAYVFYIIRVL